jgi:hypothetical protein
MEYSESKTLMAVLPNQAPCEQTHPKQLQALYSLAHKSLPWFLIGWVYGVTFFFYMSSKFPIGLFKNMSLGIGQILEASFKWYPSLFVGVTCAFWHVHSFYSFPHSIMIYPSQFKFPYHLALPQYLQADTKASSQS